MSVHMCESVCLPMSTHMEVRRQLLLLFTLCFETMSFAKPEAPKFSKQASPALGFQVHSATPGFYVGSRNPNSDPHARPTAALPTELSPQLSAHLFPMPAAL